MTSLRNCAGTLLLIALAVGNGLAQTDPSGHWAGTLDVNGNQTNIALDLAKDAKGVWIASLGVPDRNMTGIRVTDIKVEGKLVQFTAPDMPGSPNFDFTFEDGKLKGAIAARNGSLPFEMKRTGEAKVELPPTSPAVSKELEGDWEGALEIPNGPTMQLLVHFKNQTDKTAVGTMDSPSQGAKGLALSEIAEKGAQVEFKLKMVNGSFSGKLKNEGKELAGDWTQGSNTLPLTFKKK